MQVRLGQTSIHPRRKQLKEAVSVVLVTTLLVAWQLERQAMPRISAVLLLTTGLVLLADSLATGPIPGDWELTGLMMIAWGVYKLRSARRERIQRERSDIGS